MKLTNSQILSSIPVLKELQEKDLPVEVQFQLTKNLRLLESISEIFTKIKDKTIIKYCQKDENGQPVKTGANDTEVIIIDPTNLKKDILTLENIENEVDICKISMDLNLPIKDLLIIDWIFQ